MQLAFTRFQGVINQHFETNFKLQYFTTNYKHRHPWMTKVLRTQIKIKNAMHTTCFASPTRDITKFADYNKAKNFLKSSLRNAEILYYSNQFNLHKNDIAKSWKILKTIIGTNSVSINTTYTINDKLVTDSKEIANGFNNYFVSIGFLLANDIRCSINPMSHVKSIQNSIVIVNISCLEVERVIFSLKNASAGWDEIPTLVAKKCVYSWLKPLTYLINRSFTEGVFPEELKLARVVPILKAGDPSQIANYRPISVLTFFSKVFKKIMYNCILKFMDENHVFYEHQYGFRQIYSTQQAIITLVDKNTTSLDNSDIISVFLDLKKAFDTVDHHILLKKLYAYGIRGHIIKWFESYLYDRSQYVIYNNEYSETHPIKCGVPQRSILGPLLFNIYVNDICNISNFLFNIMYADDTSVLLSGDVKNKVSKGIGIIFKARAVLDQQCLLTLYNSFVYPYLIYCIEIWGTASQIHLQPLFLAQKKVSEL